MKFHILIFGCQMNYADAARISTVLKNIWWEKVKTIEEADIIVFHTCSVKQKAEDKIAGRLRNIPKDKKIWITGCMVQHNLKLNNKVKKKFHPKVDAPKGNFIGNLEDINESNINDVINDAFNPLFKTFQKKLPNLELLFRIDDLHFIPKIITYIGYKVDEKDIQDIQHYSQLYPSVSNQVDDNRVKAAFVPVGSGCNQFCSYCIVPFARGLEVYRTVEEIVDEIEHWVNKWYIEITLLGQIVNKHPKFDEIVKKILKIKAVKWLRYTSPYPTYYSDEILALHETEENLCPHIHAPVQSGSNKILKAMNRWYTIEEYKEFIDKIKALKRPISITTDMIVGFPGETEADFQTSLDLIKYAEFDMVYTGIYSSRPGTKADKNLEDDVPAEEKSRRRRVLNDVLAEISTKNNTKVVGTTMDVMITHKKWDTYIGHTVDMRNIETKDFEDENIGKIVPMEIKSMVPLKLRG